MALDFPTSPTDGQVYDNYIWVAALDAWRRLPIDPDLPYSPKFLEETTTRTANYTIGLDDVNKVVPMDGTSLTLTIPDNATVAFTAGTIVNVYNLNSTDVTIAGAAGVTVRNAGALAQFGEVSLRKRGTDEWVLAGSVS